jgi:hypothetical protein
MGEAAGAGNGQHVLSLSQRPGQPDLGRRGPVRAGDSHDGLGLVGLRAPRVDAVPVLDRDDRGDGQRLAFAMRFAGLVRGLPEPAPVRCIINANETCATFRFHQVRPGETWHQEDLDSYEFDRMIVIDIDSREPGQ